MVKVPFRLPKSCRGLTSASHIETEPPPFGFDDSPLFLCNRRDLFRLIEARDVYRIGADLLELAATDVEESRAEEAATAIAALAANRRAPTGGSSEQQSKPSPPRQVLVVRRGSTVRVRQRACRVTRLSLLRIAGARPGGRPA